MRILTDILDVMTDGYHKSGLDAQAKIFYLLIHVLTQNLVIFYLIKGQKQHYINSINFKFWIFVQFFDLKTFTSFSKYKSTTNRLKNK